MGGKAEQGSRHARLVAPTACADHDGWMAWLFSFVGYRNRVVVVGLDVAVDIAVASGDPRLVGDSKYVLLRTNDRVEMG
jgi:hypothetical protein